MAFSKARNKRFNEVLYSPPKSQSSNSSTSKNCSGHQDALLQERRYTVGRRYREWDSRAKECNRLINKKEQELFECKATLALVLEKRDSCAHGEHSRIKQLKRCADDSDSDATLSADEVPAEDNFELEFMRNRLNETEAVCAQEKMENISLTKKLNETKELLQQEKRKSKKFQSRLRQTTESNKKTGAMKTREHKLLAASSSNSDSDFRPKTQIYHKYTNLDSRIQLMNRCYRWIRSINENKKSNEAFWCDIGTILQSFPNSQECKTPTCSMDIHDEMTNIKTGICCKLEDYLKSRSEVLDMYANLMKLYSHEVELFEQYKSVAGEYIAQVEVTIETSLNFYESFSHDQVEAFCRMKDEASHNTDECILAYEELMKCRKENESLTNALETERESNLTILQDNRGLSDENQKLVNTTVELREETCALNSRVSEISGTLTRNNEQINELNAENERQSLEISTLYKTISTLERNIQQLSAEKKAVLACHSKCAPLRSEAEDLRACYNAERNKNVLLSNGLAASKSKICEMEDKIINLNKYIDQLKLEKQNLLSEFELQLESLKKSMAAEQFRNSESVKSANEELQLVKQKYEEENNMLLRAKNELRGELNKLIEEHRLQEQLYRQQIMFLETKSAEGSSEVKEQLKKSEAEKENWKTLYENLEARIAPFKDQLDAYEAEKILLLNQNDEKQHELECLSEKYARLLGHQNHKQKIKHVQKIKDENLNLKKEVQGLQEEIHKQTNIIRKLKFGEPRLDRKDPKCQEVLKENRSTSLRP